MGADIKKQYLCLDNIPVLSRTLMVFDRHDDIDQIFLVIPGNDHDFCREKIVAPFNFRKKIHLVAGGEQRQDSVFNGIKKLVASLESIENKIVLIHDGVRPFVKDSMISACISGAQNTGACIPGLKMTDTIKQVDNQLQIEKTISRQKLYCAQTPQAFKLGLILSAFEYAQKTFFQGTDDASIVEHSGHPVMISQGSKFNIKITTPEDLLLGECLINKEI